MGLKDEDKKIMREVIIRQRRTQLCIETNYACKEQRQQEKIWSGGRESQR
jgi:hypothetical protein